jgi:hypothetical protein
MWQHNKNTDELRAVMRTATFICGKYVLMGIGISLFTLILLFINHVFFSDSKIAYLQFACVTFLFTFMIIGIVQALRFIMMYYRNKNRGLL